MSSDHILSTSWLKVLPFAAEILNYEIGSAGEGSIAIFGIGPQKLCCVHKMWSRATKCHVRGGMTIFGLKLVKLFSCSKSYVKKSFTHFGVAFIAEYIY